MLNVMEVPMSLLRMLITAVVLAALLAACAVSITPSPTGPGFDYTAAGQAIVDFDDLPAVRRTISLAAGEEAWIEVTFPSSASADLMYVEIETASTTAGMELEWWNLAQTSRQLVSYSSAIFGPPSALAASTAQIDAVERSSIAAAWPCVGPCIARPYASGAKAIRVYNGTGSSRSVQIYAYGLRFTDELEPNDSESAPRNVFVEAINETIQGAIEFSGDNDYIRIDCPSTAPLSGVVQLQFDSVFAGDLVLRTSEGDVLPGGGVSGFLTCPTTVRVFADDGTAGPSFASRYTITIQ
jgi:hypothetical protein